MANNHRYRVRRLEQVAPVERRDREWAEQIIWQDCLWLAWWDWHRHREAHEGIDPATYLEGERPESVGTLDVHRALRILFPEERIPGCSQDCRCHDPNAKSWVGPVHTLAQVTAWREEDEDRVRAIVDGLWAGEESRYPNVDDWYLEHFSYLPEVQHIIGERQDVADRVENQRRKTLEGIAEARAIREANKR